MKEIKILKKEVGEDGYIHEDELEKKIGKNSFYFEWLGKKQSPTKCVFCDADWTPEMINLYISSGYCETCYDTEYKTLIACSRCGKIVYKK